MLTHDVKNDLGSTQSGFGPRTILAFVGALTLQVVMIAHAFASAVVYNDFSDTSGLVLNGSATPVNTADGSVLRLTDTMGGFAGSAFTQSKVNASTFSTSFVFRITDSALSPDGDGIPGGDGLAFVVQSASADSLGPGGGQLGYGGIANSMAVEFDTWRNGGAVAPEDDLNDPSSNHVGITIAGNPDHGIGSPYTADVTPNFDDSNIWYAWIDYDGITVDVRANQTGLRPVTPLVSRPLDLSTVLGGESSAFVGFTSGNADAIGNHYILSWQYLAVPEPSAMVLIASGIAAVVGFSRRRQNRRR